MRYLITIILSAFLISCGGIDTTHLISEEKASAIPKKANTVIVTSNQSPDEAFDSVMAQIKEKEIDTEWQNEGNRAVKTKQYAVDQQAALRMEIKVTEVDGGGSKITSTGEYSGVLVQKESVKVADALTGGNRADSEWKENTWYYPRLNKRAFAGMVEFMSELPHESISYEK